MAERPDIIVLTGALAGKRFKVPEAGLRIGRSSMNDIHLDDVEMSRSHCLFERDGEDKIAVLDLASANGTFVNGEKLGAVRCVLMPGDVVQAGDTRIQVSGGADGAASVDLGLGASPGAAPGAGSAGKGASRRSVMNLFWLLAALCAAGAAAIVFLPQFLAEPAGPAKPAEAGALPDGIVSMEYEKVEADATRIFRYALELDETGRLNAVCDDVPGGARHIDKTAKLGKAALDGIAKTLDEYGWEGLDEFYSGNSAAGGNELRSWRIRVVRGGRAKEVVVENAPEPEPFRAIREALEAFSRNELGIWAVQYSADKLREMSAESARIGDQKWNERDVEYGNLSAAVDAYREALFYLETVDPKPAGFADLKKSLATATAELDKRYNERRFLADKAINLSEWDNARTELKILCEMVPKREDPRHAEAAAKLVDVEKRAADKGKGGR